MYTFKLARQATGMTIEAACKALPCSRQKLIDIEKGRKAPTIKTLERMAQVYGLSSWREFDIPRYS